MTIFCEVTSSAEEGSSAISTFGKRIARDSDHRALFHAARKFNGVFLQHFRWKPQGLKAVSGKIINLFLAGYGFVCA
jgi:hypothetical protein